MEEEKPHFRALGEYKAKNSVISIGYWMAVVHGNGSIGVDSRQC